MSQRSGQRTQPARILVYAVVAVLAFALAAGVGVAAAVMLRSDVGSPGQAEPREQGNAARSQQKDTARPLTEGEYVSRIGDIQAKAVEAFLGSHDRLVPYDALTAHDVEEMQRNQAALKEFTDQVDGLYPPQEYREHYEVFSSAINELHEAARLAYGMAADPVAATESGFEEYDSHVNEAEALLQRSNEMLGRDFETIRGVRELSPQLGGMEIVGNSEGA
jgi:hypothetical protein